MWYVGYVENHALHYFSKHRKHELAYESMIKNIRDRDKIGNNFRVELHCTSCTLPSTNITDRILIITEYIKYDKRKASDVGIRIPMTDKQYVIMSSESVGFKLMQSINKAS